MDASALKFDPQVMALAMPSESGLSKAAEGIGNVGKVFIEADKRQEESKLNALKMEEANQTILAKKNDNSVFDEKQERERVTYLLDRRNKSIDALKKQMDYDAEVKKAGELEVTNTIRGMIPTTMFYTEGKFNRGSLDAARETWLKDPKWVGKEHVVNAVFDSKLKEIADQEKALLDNSKTQSEITHKNEETKWIAPKANAEISYKKSAETKNYAGANLDNTNASLAPTKVKAYVKQTEAAAKNAGIEDKLKDDRMKITADEMKMSSMVPNYAKLTDNQKLEVNRIYVDKGVIPTRFSDVDGNLQAVYPKGTLGSATPASVKVPVKSAGGSAPKPKVKADDEVTRLLNK